MAVCNDLDNYGALFDSKSQEFSNIVSAMENIVSSLDAGWSGMDAENFKSNANAYLHNLKLVEASMAYFGNVVKQKSAGYNNACAAFYDILNG